MARYCNGVSTYLKMSDNATLSLPDGSWALGGWLKSDSLSGSARQFVIGHAALGATPSCNIYIQEPGGDLVVRIVSNDATSKMSTNNGVVTAGAWHHLLVLCSGDTLQVYLDGSAIGSSYNAAWDGINPGGSFHLGRKNSAGHYLEGRMAAWAKWDSVLSSEQITALANGVQPPEVGTRPAWYLPLLAGLDEEIAALAVINTNTTIAEHPPRIVQTSNII